MNDTVREWTADTLEWRPFVTPVELAHATPAQREALRETPSNTPISAYVLVLALDPETLGQRTPLFNGIMYGRGGLKRAERELGATAASILNGCVYCVSVHAARFNMLTKRPAVMEALFAGRALEGREAAIVRYATRLSACPPEADASDMVALRTHGMTDGEIMDLTLSVAVFGWANRLMHTLGEPVRPKAAQP